MNRANKMLISQRESLHFAALLRDDFVPDMEGWYENICSSPISHGMEQPGVGVILPKPANS
jgi:hypothetical protein